MSDTPETDEQLAYRSFGFYTMGGLPTEAIKPSFARELERERDQYQDQADALVEQLGATQERMINAERELAAIRAIFPKILDSLKSGFCSETCSIDFLNEIPKEVQLVKERLERERDEARFDLAFRRDLYALQQKQLDEARLERDEWREVAQGNLLGAIKERDEAVRACHIWQQGHSVIVADRDYWKAEAERWRDCHHEIIADRDWLILELVEISSTADNCENTWDGLHKIAVIADNILNGRPLP